MPPLPFRPRDIVRVHASVDQALHNFFTDNSHLSAASEVAKSSTLAHNFSTLPNHYLSPSVPVRPGVILDISPDYADVALLTTLRGKAVSDIRGLFRHIIVTVHPADHKHDAASAWLRSLAVHPTWYIPGAAKHSFCLCLKNQVHTSELKPWIWKDRPVLVGEEPTMCEEDFEVLQQLCERNERLRGWFVESEIGWSFDKLSSDDVVKRCDWISESVV